MVVVVWLCCVNLCESFRSSILTFKFEVEADTNSSWSIGSDHCAARDIDPVHSSTGHSLSHIPLHTHTLIHQPSIDHTSYIQSPADPAAQSAAADSRPFVPSSPPRPCDRIRRRPSALCSSSHACSWRVQKDVRTHSHRSTMQTAAAGR